MVGAALPGLAHVAVILVMPPLATSAGSALTSMSRRLETTLAGAKPLLQPPSPNATNIKIAIRRILELASQSQHGKERQTGHRLRLRIVEVVGNAFRIGRVVDVL